MDNKKIQEPNHAIIREAIREYVEEIHNEGFRETPELQVGYA